MNHEEDNVLHMQNRNDGCSNKSAYSNVEELHESEASVSASTLKIECYQVF